MHSYTGKKIVIGKLKIWFLDFTPDGKNFAKLACLTGLTYPSYRWQSGPEFITRLLTSSLFSAGLLWRWRWEGIHLQGAKVHSAVGDFPEAPEALLRQVWSGERQDHSGLRQGGITCVCLYDCDRRCEDGIQKSHGSKATPYNSIQVTYWMNAKTLCLLDV